jgi:DNA-binding Lrp family transcriptional regulator
VHHAWGRTPYIPGYGGGEYFPLEEIPQFMPLPEQRELASQKIRNLSRYEFLVRPAAGEGEVSTSVIPIRIAGEERFPDQELLTKVRLSLAKMAGKPIESVLKAQESGLAGSAGIPGVAKAPSRSVARPDGSGGYLPPAKAVAAEPRQRPPKITAPPPPGKRTPQRAPLPPGAGHASEEEAFLRFLLKNPDTPLSAVYKGLGISRASAERIREHLKEQGLLAEVTAQSSPTGRPARFLIPTFQAFELLGEAPPSGRGGAVHRHIQQAVSQGAYAKGYRTQVEYALASGGIVDVHLEKDGLKLAVEVAVVSTVERERAHITECLAFGYDTVYGIYIDQHLLERTQQTLTQELTAEEREKVRLLPLSRLSGIW